MEIYVVYGHVTVNDVDTNTKRTYSSSLKRFSTFEKAEKFLVIAEQEVQKPRSQRNGESYALFDSFTIIPKTVE